MKRGIEILALILVIVVLYDLYKKYTATVKVGTGAQLVTPSTSTLSALGSTAFDILDGGGGF